ncbi:amino acid ABC transporter permease [Hydrogenophaga sp.]|uniref:amino acid ABC transporter permease n=1 Tax=Hydrogenophaga sp. TaxID=1904254 RepID=UPI002611EB35|nr:amino acid ABC transporter permease [Hydrogenophaga sp.]MCW5655382.1 amino acid ABC transporter permease [Hydrogenophaga sp.]
MDYVFDFGVVAEHSQELLLGCLKTLQLSGLSIVLALLLSLLLSLGLRSRFTALHWLIVAFIEVVRNTPFLVQIFVLFFGLPVLGIRMSPTVAAVVALTLNGAAYVTEIIRGGLESIAKGQSEAGLALGLRPLQVFRFVILKPALRAIYPSLVSQFIFLMLTSSIVSSISADELTHVAAVLEGRTFRSFEIYFVVAGLYLLLSALLSAVFALIHRLFLSYPTR